MNFIEGWYVIYTKSRYEKKIAQKLTEENFKVFLPLNSTISQWSDRKKRIEKPLFSSYVFVYLETIKDYLKALTVDGVVLFIKFGGRLVRVLDEEINSIKIFLNQFSQVELKNSLAIQVGEKKRIISGPFESYECEIIKIDNKQKICVRIGSLEQSLIAEIHSYHLI
ncbi:UpxY family transcription antiterminator [Chryseobacterium gambrini]|uniref:UpxY family transcription antiterminator n=1 Tax=Chryseobacterium gambrini TaxID=373672 RepID=A0AAJ1R2W6_9FLAO|nr:MULTISPECIES: UpxY family transcription antiterminator [Chryseobacterium]MDN4012926.1 UpxY family transcription antiterminator [Chryseobacterium gambrini]MDN4030565.1 UpxY family transcription antiterminator [Chryseobacterium gambrini]QWA36539.1 UpxY family transcription antiterminator [Chryseobacterium sp. ZHDP1]